MIINTTGQVKDDFYVTGLTWSPSFLLTGEHPVLFESGFTCAGPLYERDIRQFTVGREPEMLFLTHVHYDHCGATGYLKRVFPGLKKAGSALAAAILARPNARELMVRLSSRVIPLVAGAAGVDEKSLLQEPFAPFEFDLTLDDGQIIRIGEELTVQVLATPGHTRDLLSYYIPERKILIATEATGILDRAGNFGTEFIADYDLYLASLKRLAALEVEVLCQGHHFVFVGREEVERFFVRSIEATGHFKTRVYTLLEAQGGSIERVVTAIKAEQYDSNPNIKQPETAYLLNLTARVTHLAERRQREMRGGA
jgi:glyoxylase-like metal-dependent hydrolase (beta-lactamase superfamily II)